MKIETFPALDLPGLRHGFSTRSPVALDGLDGELISSFRAAGFPMERAVQGEQTHGNQVAMVAEPSVSRIPGVDALATAVANLPLVIRVADCGPVFLYDPVRRAIGLAHSGRRGTEGNIVGETIAVLKKAYGSDPRDLVVLLGPCIRPPHYEVDFAAEIRRQAREAGVMHYHDSAICTASRMDLYYSYRMEKGKTGRMWAVLMLG